MKANAPTIAFGLAATLLAAPWSASLAAPPNTGIEGQTFLYISYGRPFEIEPGVWAGIPSVQLPTATSLTILAARNGREIGRVTTDANGLYSISLPPGDYVVVPDEKTVGPVVDCRASTNPIEVTVRPKQFSLANIFYFREGPCHVFASPMLFTEEGDEADTDSPLANQSYFFITAEPSEVTTKPSREQENRGYHQSGITGAVHGGFIIATPTGEGSRVVPNHVRVYTDTFPRALVAEVETVVRGNVWWYYEVNLKPGQYLVTSYVGRSPEEGGRFFTYPISVTVEKREFTNVPPLSFAPMVYASP